MFPGPPWGRALWDSVPPLLPAAIADSPRWASHSEAQDGRLCVVLLTLSPCDPRASETVSRCVLLSAAAPMVLWAPVLPVSWEVVWLHDGPSRVRTPTLGSEMVSQPLRWAPPASPSGHQLAGQEQPVLNLS